MTDTPIIALYYREHDPMKRKMFLDQSIAAGEDEEANAVRKELWELRYGEPSQTEIQGNAGKERTSQGTALQRMLPYG